MQKETLQGFAFSPQQQRLWELAQGDPCSLYRTQAVVRITGALDRERLEAAVRGAVRRHEILRTRFRQLPGMPEPLQVIADDGLAWQAHEGADVEAVREAAWRRELDLEEGPALFADLVRLGETGHALVLTLPALCADRTTLVHLAREIGAAYTQRPLPQPDAEPLQYADFAQWQNELLASEEDEQSEFWSRLDLSALRSGATGPFDPRAVRLALAPGMAAGIHALARAHGVSPEALLLACWAVLLGRCDRQEEVLVGAAVQGRDYEELQEAMGLFAKHLPVRARVRADALFSALLGRVQQSLEEACLQQEGFAWSRLGPARRDGGPLFFPYAFEYEERVPAFDGLALAEQRSYTERFEARLSCVEAGGELSVELHHDASALSEGDATRLGARFTALLDAVLADPETPVGELEILGREERQRLLVEWNRTGLDLPLDLPLHVQVARQAEKTPEAVAVVFGDLALTYGELVRRSARLAAFLRGRGIGPESLVGVRAERSLELVVALLGVLEAGAAYLPLDPAYPAERLEAILADARPAAVLARPELEEALPDRTVEPAGTADNTAYVIYTSGSTGRPKGVVVSHRAIVNRLLWMQEAFPLAPGDRVLQKTPFSFDASIWELFSPLLAGATVVVARPGGHQDPAYLVEAVVEHEVTRLQLVPSLLRVVLEEPGLEACRSLRRLFCGGEALPTAMAERWASRLPEAALTNLYGPTEAAIDATYWPWSEGVGGTTVPIGRPVANMRVYLLDERRRPVPEGLEGELCIGGPGLARGYLGRPDLTAERFVPDPVSGEPGARLYRTGDLARHLPEGALEFRGRIDHQVKVRGFRIEPGEIEAALRLHPRVREAVVVAREDEAGHKRLVAYVVSDAASGELRAFLASKLPEHMVPAALVSLAALPLTTSGKVDRNALPEPAAEARAAAAFVAPRTAAEERLAAIWADLLRTERVGVHDNFFELGGDSILAIQIVARARQAGLQITPRQLFQHQTVASLAAAASVPAAAVEEDLPEGEVPLTPIQHAFFERELVDAHHYNQAVLLEVRPPLTATALESAFAAVATHHDAFRLRFERRDGAWRQFYAPPSSAPWVHVDLSGLPEEARREALQAAASAVQRSLDIERGPVLRAVWFDWGAAEPARFLVVAHHLVVDGVSWRILLEELETGELPPRTSSFQRWAERLREHVRSGALEPELGYWLAPERAEALPLPVDGDRDANTVGAARTLVARLDEEETRALLRRKRIDEVLLSALARAFAAWTGPRPLRVDLEGHGREEVGGGLDLSRTVGWFTSLYPVLLDGDVQERLRAVPGKGLGYGLLRYLGEGEAAAALRAQPAAEVSFNYLGQLDRALSGSSPFAPARESAGPMQSPRQRRSYLLDVTASVAGGRLQVGWTYGEKVFQRRTVERLAEGFLEALRSLIAAGVEDVYPLTPVQEGLLFHALRDGGSGVYVQQLTCTLVGELDEVAFTAAWQGAVDRYAVLRTGFTWEGERPRQVVRSKVELPIERLDWTGLEAGERLEAFLEADRERGFDPAVPPLMRVALIRLGERRHQLVWTHHHLVLDGWSVPLLIRRVFDDYRGVAVDAESRPFRDYVDWLERQDRAAAEAYWRRTLADVTEPTPLGVDRPGGPAGSGLARTRLSEETTDRLRGLARRCQVTLNTVVQGAWALLLARYSGRRDVVFGIVSSGRPADLPGAEAMVGVFINSLPVRVETAPERPVASWLAGIQEGQAELRQYDYAPLVEVQGWSGVPRGVALFGSILVFENYPVDEALRRQETGVAVEGVRFAEQTHYPLSVAAAPGAALPLQIAWRTESFDAATVLRMLGHLEALLAAMVEQSEARLGDLSPFTAAELHQVLAEANDTATSSPDYCLHELFAAQAARTPAAPAVSFRGESLTYAELDRRAGRLARRLRVLGVGPESVVGLRLERSLDLAVALLGILKAGGAWLPLDPGHPAERLAMLVSDARPRVLIEAGDELLAGLDASGEEGEILSGAAPDNLAYVIYTSGSTGRPKGVEVPHRAIANRVLWTNRLYPLGADDRVLQKTPLSFDASIWELFAPWAAGACVVLAEPGLHRDPEGMARAVADEGITVLQLVPSMLQLFAETPGLDRCRSLRRLFSGGEALPSELAERLQTRLGVEVVNLYGPTETAIDSCSWPCRLGTGRGVVPIGRPLDNLRVHLLDRDLRPAPLEAPGRLYVGGPSLARGYLGRPDLTAERFVPDPFGEAGARLYDTGDLAHLRADGVLEFLGRADSQVKVRGVRIEPGEVEAALMRHPRVREAAVVARPDGSGGNVLVAYVAADADAAELRAFLRRELPEAMVPSLFVPLAALPRTASGKLDRRALPEPGASALDGDYRAPRTPVEEVLAGIWADVLRVGRVGADDDFFELGGHSLLATRVVSALRAALGVELPLRALFETPTLAGLATAVEAARRAALGLEAPPLVRAPRQGLAPLSFAQQRLWFLDRLGAAGAAYNIPLAVRLVGRLDVPALGAALDGIVRRHEVLRTTYAETADGPVQVIGEAVPVPLPVLDLSGLAPAAREAEASRLAAAGARRPFDLARGPVLRAALLRLGGLEHVALLTVHHIACDGWSSGLLLRELAALYGASPLPPLPLQYADFAVWQRGWLRGEALERQLAWWRGRLAGTPALLELPADRPRPAVAGTAAGRVPLAVPGRLREAVEVLARREGATLFMALLAVFQVLLARYAGREDVVVGTPVAGRNRAETEGLIGLFVNTLALRTDLSGDPDWRGLLARVREAALGAYDHQDLPFEKLVEELQPERSLSHAPLFQILFVLQNTPLEDLGDPAGSGLSLSPVATSNGASELDWTLTVLPAREGLAGTLDYRTDLFDGVTALRALGHFAVLLEELVRHPERPLSRAALLTAPELHQVVVEHADTATVWEGAPGSLHRLIEVQAARTPGAVALDFEGDRLTYGELNGRANQLARHLRSLGAGRGTLVGLCVERSLEMLVGLLGVLKAGAAYVPLDPGYPADRLAFMLEDAAVPVLLTQERLRGSLPDGPARVVALDADWEAVAVWGSEDLPDASGGDELAYVIYTSGSTGRPKGAMNSHRAIVNRLLWMQETYGLTAADRVLQKTPFSFDVSVWELFWPLLAGARLVIARPEGHRDPAYLARRIREAEVTVLHFVPAMLSLFLEEPDAGSCRSLRLVVCSGEALPEALQERFFSRLDCALHNLYGPTEAAVDVTWWACRRDGGRGTVPIGRPVSNTAIHLLDRDLRPVPPGVPGELYISGVQLARGYLGRPALTAERFVPDPLSEEPGQRLYRTGDLARRLPDGSVDFLGRTDHQVKVRGFRVELGEVEAALLAHPAVREAAAQVREDRPGHPLLVAYVVPEEGSAVRPDELRAFLGASLPEPMVPSLFVALPALPLSPNGKVDRKSLPTPEIGMSEESGVQTPVEEVLAAIWCGLLGRERVGTRDNFFALGGHSLLAVQVVSRVREILGVELPIRALFEAPTVAQLAAVCAGAASASPAPPLVRASRETPPPLSLAQQRLWVLDRMERQGATYNIASALRLTGALDVAALERALDEIARRHEVLRTRIAEVDDEPVQVVMEAGCLDLPLVDLRELPEEARQAETRRLAAAEAARPFDLERGPLVRALLLRLATEEHAGLFTLHHIVSDGWSIGVLVRELGTLYEAFAAGRPSPLAELPLQYADYASWQRRWLRDEALETRLGWWRRQLAGAPTLLSFPADRPSSAVRSVRGDRLVFQLDAALSRSLRDLGRREGATPFMIVLAAFAALLRHGSGQDEVLVGTNSANRDQVEVEGLIGLFVNLLPLRVDLSGDPDMRELLRRVREVALGAYAHREVPFDRLVSELRIERVPGRSPLVQAVLNFEGGRMSALRLPGLELAPVELAQETTPFDLQLQAFDSGDGPFYCSFVYSRDLFEPATVARLRRGFEACLELFAGSPESRLSGLAERLEAAAREEKEAKGEVFQETRRRLLSDLKGRPKPVPVMEISNE